jgi:hypothetical protein
MPIAMGAKNRAIIPADLARIPEILAGLVPAAAG